MVADELDVPVESVSMVMGDTARTVNKGGASGGTGIQAAASRCAWPPPRRAACWSRWRQKSSACRGPADASPMASSRRQRRGKEHLLCRAIGGRYFHAQIEWNGQIGNALYFAGKAKPKKPKDYKVIGKSIPRRDIATRSSPARHTSPT